MTNLVEFGYATSVKEVELTKAQQKELKDLTMKDLKENARVKCSTLQALTRDFEILEMKVGEVIIEYFARVMNIVNKMGSNEEDMKEVTIVKKILRNFLSSSSLLLLPY
ncbi:hypothetical protein CR513_61637, partial [Mucuna pruriens]